MQLKVNQVRFNYSVVGKYNYQQGRIQDFQKGEARSWRKTPASIQMPQLANSEKSEQQQGTGDAAHGKFCV